MIDDITLQLKKDKKEKPFTEYNLSKYKTKPYQYQLDGIQYGLNHNKFLLLDAPGLGKTLQIIYLAYELKKRDNIKHCLIICGINTLKNNWKKEIQKHSNLSCRILGERQRKSGKIYIGGTKDRLEDLKKPLKEFFIITNVETLRDSNIIKELTKGKANEFDMIVVDELHTCKSPTSQQGKHLLKLNSKYQVGATGTLLLNNPLDAYVPLRWLGVDKSTFTNYKYYYCNYSGQFNNILLGFRNTHILKDQIEKYSLRRTKDLLDLPPKTIINEYVEMNDEQSQFYDNIKQGIIDQVDKVHMSTANLLAMVARLRQATACPSILTSDKITSSKIERAMDLAKQIIDNGDKVVIFSTFKETINLMLDGAKQFNPLVCTGDISDIEISQNVDKFQTCPENKIMFATWQKMGTGITLTAASYAIFLDTPWTDGVYQQAQDRIHRIGSKSPVFIYNLICKNTIDERVLEIVQSKQAISDYIIDDKVNPQTIDSLKNYIEELAESREQLF